MIDIQLPVLVAQWPLTVIVACNSAVIGGESDNSGKSA